MKQKLYVVYAEDDSVYIVKAQNKKEAINLVYSHDCGEYKKDYVAQDLEKELFKAGGFDRNVVMLI